MARTKKVRWTHRARADLLEIGQFIAADDPRAARRWVERLRLRALTVAAVPLSGRRVPEIGRDDVREVLVRTYRIVYQIVPGGIDVLTVFEGHRLFPAGVVSER